MTLFFAIKRNVTQLSESPRNFDGDGATGRERGGGEFAQPAVLSSRVNILFYPFYQS